MKNSTRLIALHPSSHTSQPSSVRIVALGCAKNKVDSERVAASFAENGWDVVPDGKADVVIVTTCGFIEEASQESINVLLEEIEAKGRGETSCLVAAGCLPERYRNDLADELPVLDIIAGVSEFGRLRQLVEEWFAKPGRRACFTKGRPTPIAEGPRLLSGVPGQAWLKIADGCNRACSFCTIPGIRGSWQSVPMTGLIQEARTLVESGVVELTLTAQDTTAYGFEGGKPRLWQLLRELDSISGLRWIRLMYAHPRGFADELIDAVVDCEKVLAYLDIPMQHASDRMLKLMNRKIDAAGQNRLLATLRDRIPDLVMRTTLLVGHPGETEEDFEELLEFAAKQRFENLGAFAYSREDGTASSKMADQVPAEVAADRLDRLMSMQQEISRQALHKQIGCETEVLVEEELPPAEDLRYTHSGRASIQAPEVDGITYLHVPAGQKAHPGQIVKARIEISSEYDLFATASD